MKKVRRGALVLALLMLLTQSAWADASGSWISLSDADADSTWNAVLAAMALDGCYLPQGGVFSFNQATGVRDDSAGYVSAIGAWGDVEMGGGAELTATALYHALQGLSRVEFLALSTAPNGSVLVDDREGQDFSFYNYGRDLSIQMTSEDDGITCTVTSAEDKPQKRGAQASAVLRRTISMPESMAWLQNVQLACSSINDISLLPGDVFSFNAVVGPRSEAYGYQAAENGYGEEECGGGADAVASALYMVVGELADAEVLEANLHDGRADAELEIPWQYCLRTDDAQNQDFAFLWNGSGVLTVYAWLDGNMLTVEVEIG